MSDVHVWSRDVWLAQAVDALRWICSRSGLEVPPLMVASGQVSVQKDGRPVRAECSPSWVSVEGLPLVIVGEHLSDPVEILGCLLHEMIHAADDCLDGHGDWFRGWARALGLEGDVRSTQLGRQLRNRLSRLCIGLGPYPSAEASYALSQRGWLVA